MGELEDAKAKAAAANNAAADYFDHPASSFWHRFGQQTVERLGLQRGRAWIQGQRVSPFEERSLTSASSDF